jgi:TP53 regulating kinase and related kinases
MTQKIIQQGAEAIIYLDKNKIIKDRVKKSYRIKELDEKIRKLRTRSETKILKKASEIILVPKIIGSDEKTKKITMEFIDGEKLSEELNNFPLEKQKKVCKKITENIIKIHDKNIIHGDLTTSNMILKNNEVYFIDFGLGFISHKFEDKAVDLHLLKQALEAKHFENYEILWKIIESEYKKQNQDTKTTLERLKAVEKRGRYKH